jgi:hypothetical protein
MQPDEITVFKRLCFLATGEEVERLNRVLGQKGFQTGWPI